MKPDQERKRLSMTERFVALSRVSVALMSELDETKLLQLIAETACELTGAEFAAFSLRPADRAGQPLVPSEGNLFHLAAVVGVTPEQEALFRRMPLGGEGLLAPIFRHGVAVLVGDALQHVKHSVDKQPVHDRDSAREAASAFVHGEVGLEELRSMGVPSGHPVVRSFLGAPLMDRDKQVRGGLLLGHTRPDQFTTDDEAQLVGLASQAAVALENARLYRTISMRAQELNAIFDSITDGITLVDRQERVVRENGAARRLREQVQKYSEEQFGLEALLHAPARLALKDQIVQDSTVVLSDENGEVKEYLVTASPLLFPKTSTGALLQNSESRRESSGVVVVWHDVTERRLREAERATRAYANQLEAIFEAMTDGVFVYDRDGRSVQTNAVARALLARISPADVFAFLSPERVAEGTVLDSPALAQWPVARVLAGELLTPENALDISYRTSDGQIMYTSVTGSPLYDAGEQLVGAVIVAHDVTEHRRLEQVERDAHAEAEERLALLQMILDELPSSVYLVHGEDAQLVLANRAATSVWGAHWPYDVPMVTFLETQGIAIFGMDGRLLAPSQLATLRAVREGKDVYQHQESIRHADGTLRPALVNAVSLNSWLPSMRKSTVEGDTERAAIVVHQDMTALKETERLKDEFIALAAHELRTPLAILQGFAQTLLIQTARGKGPKLADWQTEALQEIDQATARMVDLTTDLLDVTLLQSGRLELHLEPADIIELSMRMMARLQLTTQLHRFSYSSEHPHLIVCVDPARIEQIMGNLLSNAVKYSPKGGVIEIAVRQDEDTHVAIVSIRDQGIGIPVDQQAHLFNRFERAGNARAFGISGTGLGLYLCRELIERHNGHIWFESVEGEGATFFFSLPLYDANGRGEKVEISLHTSNRVEEGNR